MEGKLGSVPYGDFEGCLNAEDPGSTHALGSSSPLQYSCLENPTDRGA